MAKTERSTDSKISQQVGPPPGLPPPITPHLPGSGVRFRSPSLDGTAPLSLARDTGDHPSLTKSILPGFRDTTCPWFSSYFIVCSLLSPASGLLLCPCGILCGFGELWTSLCLWKSRSGQGGHLERTPGRVSLGHQNRQGSTENTGTLTVSNGVLCLHHLTESSE